ncbi:MAG: deoxyribose-phosphate aldolase [Thermoflexus sp.]|jgi:deoxyribose-phosphate aldolase|nr:deoxyribose-phosphate aldolase [Thermoflexus sp.]MDT7947256.1 deoxyribose-phosphate aldolase [Thermoflexus sp.]
MIASLDVRSLTLEQLAKTIDHSLLRPELTDEEVRAGIELAKRYGVAAVCVKPCHVRMAAELLAGTDVKVCTVIGFPHGSQTTAVKVYEAQEAVANGATELDMVINIGKLRSGDDEYVLHDIRAVVEAVRGQAIVKVILENAYLTDEQKVRGCRLAEAAGAAFVKTSTGFAPSGCTVEDIRLMRAAVGPHVQIKAAHGIRTLEQALAVLEAGATRIGATATAQILEAFKARQGGTSPISG